MGSGAHTKNTQINPQQSSRAPTQVCEKKDLSRSQCSREGHTGTFSTWQSAVAYFVIAGLSCVTGNYHEQQSYFRKGPIYIIIAQGLKSAIIT